MSSLIKRLYWKLKWARSTTKQITIRNSQCTLLIRMEGLNTQAMDRLIGTILRTEIMGHMGVIMGQTCPDHRDTTDSTPTIIQISPSIHIMNTHLRSRAETWWAPLVKGSRTPIVKRSTRLCTTPDRSLSTIRRIRPTQRRTVIARTTIIMPAIISLGKIWDLTDLMRKKKKMRNCFIKRPRPSPRKETQ